MNFFKKKNIVLFCDTSRRKGLDKELSGLIKKVTIEEMIYRPKSGEKHLYFFDDKPRKTLEGLIVQFLDLRPNILNKTCTSKNMRDKLVLQN